MVDPPQSENPHLRLFTVYLLRDPRASLADIKVAIYSLPSCEGGWQVP